MSTIAALAAISALTSAFGPSAPPRFAIYGEQQGQKEPALYFYPGGKLVSCSDVANYVPAWQAVAAVDSDGFLMAVTENGSKRICPTSYSDPNAALAVSPDGRWLAVYSPSEATLVIADTRDGHTVRSISWKDLAKWHIPAMNALVVDAGVVFEPGGKSLLVGFPERTRQLNGDGTTGEILVRVPLAEGKPPVAIGFGAPFGYYRGKLVVIENTRLRFLHGSTFFTVAGGAAGLSGKNLVWAHLTDDKLVADVYSHSLKRRDTRLRIPMHWLYIEGLVAW